MRQSIMYNLKNQVKDILIRFPETRNSDIALTIKIWTSYYSTGDSIPVAKLYHLPREDNVKRIRAKYCELGCVWAYPTEEKIAKARKINSDKWRSALWYRTIDKSNLQEYRILNPDGSVDRIIKLNKTL